MMYDVWFLDYGKDGKDGKDGNGLALCARWVFSTDIFCPTEIAESTEIYFFFTDLSFRQKQEKQYLLFNINSH